MARIGLNQSQSELGPPHKSSESWFKFPLQVQLSGNVRPLNTATRFLMITVQITDGGNSPSTYLHHLRSSPTDMRWPCMIDDQWKVSSVSLVAGRCWFSSPIKISLTVPLRHLLWVCWCGSLERGILGWVSPSIFDFSSSHSNFICGRSADSRPALTMFRSPSTTVSSLFDLQ